MDYAEKANKLYKKMSLLNNGNNIKIIGNGIVVIRDKATKTVQLVISDKATTVPSLRNYFEHKELVDYKINVIGGRNVSKLTDTFMLMEVKEVDFSEALFDNLESMHGTFAGMSAQKIKIGNAVAPLLEEMCGTFRNSDIDELTLRLETPSLSGIGYLFYGCRLNRLVCININTSNVKDMELAFCKFRLTKGKLDLSNWDTSQVEDITGMFSECDTDIIGIDKLIFKNLIIAKECFYQSRLKSIDISNWNTERLMDTTGMFREFKGEIKGIESLNTTKLRYADQMFEEYTNENQTIDISEWNINLLERANRMFCNSHIKKVIMRWGNKNTHLKEMQTMFLSSIIMEVEVHLPQIKRETNIKYIFSKLETNKLIIIYNYKNDIYTGNMMFNSSKIREFITNNNTLRINYNEYLEKIKEWCVRI